MQTPIDSTALNRLLKACPTVSDAKRALVVGRFVNGADIGYRGDCRAGADENNQSALRRHAAVTAAIEVELAAGTTKGPFRDPPFPGFVVNPLSARDRSDGGARLILDLSAPRGESVNDGIDAESTGRHTPP